MNFLLRFRALMTADERAWFDDLVAREWLILETAGGITEIKKRVAWVCESPSRLLRSAALFDGDAVEPPKAARESTEQLRRRLHPNSRRALDACQDAQFGDIDAFPHHLTRRPHPLIGLSAAVSRAALLSDPLG